MKSLSPSVKIYIGVILFLCAVKILFLLFPTAFPLAEQESAFRWTTITVIALLGFVGLVLSRKTGIPDIWDFKVTARQRFLLPTIIGVIYGVITVIRDLPSPSPVHLPLPLSIAFYSYGAVFLEILLRLFAIPFLVWLISHLILRGRWQTPVFWLAVVIAALYEPLPHISRDVSGVATAAVPLILVKWIFQPLFLANVVSGWLLRNYGFLAPLTLRLSFYLVWHIIYGGLISTAG